MAVAKIERLLDLIAALLHTERPLTAEQLQERIPGYPEEKDSFKRAFERDKKDLRDMGVPLRIEAVPGSRPPEDGYRIDPEEYYLPDPGLDADELAAIHLAASAVRLEGASAAAGARKRGTTSAYRCDEPYASRASIANCTAWLSVREMIASTIPNVCSTAKKRRGATPMAAPKSSSAAPVIGLSTK